MIQHHHLSIKWSTKSSDQSFLFPSCINRSEVSVLNDTFKRRDDCWHESWIGPFITHQFEYAAYRKFYVSSTDLVYGASTLQMISNMVFVCVHPRSAVLLWQYWLNYKSVIKSLSKRTWNGPFEWYMSQHINTNMSAKWAKTGVHANWKHTIPLVSVLRLSVSLLLF